MHKITAEYLASQGLSQSFPSRFFENVEITEGCWFWTGSRRKKGLAYGNCYRGVKMNGSYTILAHKASWVLHFGPVPDGQCVCHDCPSGDCPYCVNPAHLWIGTDEENFKDMRNKGRGRKGPLPAIGGERNHWSKFTNEQADEIRKLYVPHIVSQRTLARRFGVSKPIIANIVRAKSYLATGATAIEIPRRLLSKEQEEKIRQRYASGKESQQSIADDFKVSQVLISQIVRRITRAAN